MSMQVLKGAKNKTLRTVSKPVGAITAELRNFALDMIKTMDSENGVGIAAPQVGRNIRLVICKFNPGDKNEVLVPMVNPVIIQLSEETVWGEEGCLSLPDVWGMVERARDVIVKFKNLKGEELTFELSDFNARIIQHEINHLDGVLFIDIAKDIRKGKQATEGIHI